MQFKLHDNVYNINKIIYKLGCILVHAQSHVFNGDFKQIKLSHHYSPPAAVKWESLIQ